MFKTRIKLKELESFVDLTSNMFTLYITYSVHGRRDYSKANKLCRDALHRLFPPITKAGIVAYGWVNARCTELRYAVKLLITDKPVYRVYDSWRG